MIYYNDISTHLKRVITEKGKVLVYRGYVHGYCTFRAVGKEGKC